MARPKKESNDGPEIVETPDESGIDITPGKHETRLFQTTDGHLHLTKKQAEARGHFWAD